jgi:hypothetical protein
MSRLVRRIPGRSRRSSRTLGSLKSGLRSCGAASTLEAVESTPSSSVATSTASSARCASRVLRRAIARDVFFSRARVCLLRGADRVAGNRIVAQASCQADRPARGTWLWKAT